MAERDESDINRHVRRVTSMSWNESQDRSINPEKAEKAEQLMDAIAIAKVKQQRHLHESFIVKLSGLNWALTQEQIHGFLVGCEIVRGQAGVTIEMNDRGKPSGSAFVQLKTRKDVDMAMKYNKNTLGKRYVDIEDVTRKHGEAKDENTKSRSTLFTHQKEGPKEGKFYVKMSNVSRKVTAANITDFFSSDNNLRISEIFLTLNDKGKPSGDAFVKLDSKEDLVVALEFNGRAMGNRQIEVCQVNMQEYQEAKKQQKLGH